MRVVFATDNDFWYEDQGSRARIAALVRFFAARGDTVAVFYTRRLKPEDEQRIAERFAGVQVEACPQPPSAATTAPVPAPATKSTLSRSMRKLFGAKDSVTTNPKVLRHADKKLSDFRSQHHIEKFRAFCESFDPDVVIVVFIRLSALVEAFSNRQDARPVTVIDTIDVMHLRAQRFHANNEPHWVDISRDEEIEALRPFDVIAAIQDRDAEVFRGMLPGARVIVVGHPIPIEEHGEPGNAVVRVAYVASGGVPNRKAIEAFLAEVWPAIRRVHGDRVELHIAGAICGSIAPESVGEGVVLRGFVDELSRFYAETDIVVNPVTFGGGLKIKCVEALCHGRPLVTTPVGAEGMESGAGTAFDVAPTLPEFATMLNGLVASPARRRGRAANALVFARARFSEAAAYDELLRTVEQAQGREV